jgi:hypothetical protein
MSLIDNAQKHFESQRTLKKIEVPEWGGAYYYFDPPNLAERNKVLEHYDAERDRFSTDAMTEMFMVRGRKEDGSPLFSRAAWDESFKQVSQNFDPTVVQRVCHAMGGIFSIFGGVTSEEAEKN